MYGLVWQDIYVPLFSYQTTKTIDAKKLEFPRRSLTSNTSDNLLKGLGDDAVVGSGPALLDY